MLTTRTVSDRRECRDIWNALMPADSITNLWEVRDCFHRHYSNQPYFVVCEDGGSLRGLLPLSWSEETRTFHFFPGETWEGKTWLEQNVIVAENREVLTRMLAVVPGGFHLRYLQSGVAFQDAPIEIDEMGYLFLPGQYGYDMETYFLEFSHKSARRLKKELASWYERKVTIGIDQDEDFELMIDMNVSRYGTDSYFYDKRFAESFRSLMHLLRRTGSLRMTTVLVDGVPAAVDMGSVHRGAYTLLAGGTRAEFPGVAKLINIAHMTWACEQRLEQVDFLCGEFNWKPQFHLTPNPLYKLVQDVRTTAVPAWTTATTGRRARSIYAG